MDVRSVARNFFGSWLAEGVGSEQFSIMKITVAGLGIIGSIWLRHYHKLGFQVRGWNRTLKELSHVVPDLRQAVAGAEVLHVVVADPPAVDSVLREALPALPAGALVIQSSTIDPKSAARFAQLVREAGKRYVEAPFTGSKPAAEARDLVFYLGGDQDEVDSAREVLKGIARAMPRIGTVEQAAALKLSMNLQIAAIAQALGEGLSLARNYGVQDEQFFECLAMNAASSGVSRLKEPKLKAEDFSPQFSVKHMEKDLRLALSSAGPLHLRLTSALVALYAQGIQAGWAGEDFSALIRLCRLESVS